MKGSYLLGVVIEGFHIRKFLKDYESWIANQVKDLASSNIKTADDLQAVLYEMEMFETTQELIDDLNTWSDVTVDEMVFTFKNHQVNSKQMLLFLEENQHRYFTKEHLVMCSHAHVQGVYPLDSGVDGDNTFCPFCKSEFVAPRKSQQPVVFNWLKAE